MHRARWIGLCAVVAVGLIVSLGACRKRSTATPRPTQSSKPAPAGPKPLAPPRFISTFHKGIALGLYGDRKGLTMRQSLEEIRQLGATHVLLVTSWRQETVTASSIAPRKKKSYSDPVLIGLIRHARSVGLRPFLMPILRLKQRKDEDWRGTIRPRDPQAWWQSYERFILHYAALAQREQVDLFSVGSELVSMESQRARWQALIAKVRAIYRGKLIYSANWDHYKPVRFWDLVDVIGLTGYYELTKSKTASVDALTQAWLKIRREIEGWQKRMGKPFMFTELGYHSRDGSAIYPWDYTMKTAIDLEEQRRCYAAFFTAWNGSRALGGVYFWIWWDLGGPSDGHYTPRGKPAERVLEHWFGGKRKPRAVPQPTPARRTSR